MDKIENVAKKNGCNFVKLPSSFTAFEFYKKLGYIKIKMLHSDEYGDTIEMKKRL